LPCGSKNGSPPFEQFSGIFGRCRGTRFVDVQATEFAPASIQEMDVSIIKRDPDQCGDSIENIADSISH
jgi:hypothetical protein